MIIKIVRRWFSKESTIGELTVDGARVCYTLELPWKNNKVRVSCIPTGRYRIRLRDGQKEGSVFKYKHLHVMEVPGRSWILIHKGNFPDDVLGCIVPGMLKGKDVVWHSRQAFATIISQAEKAVSEIFLEVEEEGSLDAA